MKGDTVTCIILFVAIIGISLWILQASSVKSSSYVPYSPNKYAAYEGYQNMNYSDTNTHTSIVHQPRPGTSPGRALVLWTSTETIPSSQDGSG